MNPFFRIGLCSALSAACFGVPLRAQTDTVQNSATLTPASAAHRCAIDNRLPTDGENDLAKENYDKALAFYRDAVAKTPESAELHLGLVRALIGKDQTTEAAKEAAEDVVKFPESALAQVAAGEAAFRAADFESSSQDVKAAYKLNSCDARALDLMAELLDVTARFASSAKLLDVAHRLRPNDELILRDWIGSLPRHRRAEELMKYLEGSPAISDREHEAFINEQDHLKARRPGECQISSRSKNSKIPFVAIRADPVKIKAYGLDVAFNKKRRRLQIDTGASGIVLTPDAAKRLGLVPELKLHTGGVGDSGDVESYLTHVENIQVGDVQFSDCMVEVLTKYKMNDGIDGLIGLDVFDRWLATLDYPNHQLVLDPLPPRPAELAKVEPNSSGTSDQAPDDEDVPKDAIKPPNMQNWIHFIRIGHNIMLPAMANSSPLHYMIMDTGASESTFSIGFAKETGKARRDNDVVFSGLSGRVKEVYRVDNETLQFGPVRLPPGSFYAFDLTRLSHDVGAEVSGFAGLPTLSRLTITVDYRDNLMQLQYDPNHDPAKYLNNGR